jgi:hypothetical protein
VNRHSILPRRPDPSEDRSGWSDCYGVLEDQ